LLLSETALAFAEAQALPAGMHRKTGDRLKEKAARDGVVETLPLLDVAP